MPCSSGMRSKKGNYLKDMNYMEIGAYSGHYSPKNCNPYGSRVYC